MRFVVVALNWFVVWIYYVALTLMAGAVLGVGSHVLVGPFFVEAPEWVELAAHGFLRGVHLAGLWAGGLGIVLCFMRGARRRASAASAPETEAAGRKA